MGADYVRLAVVQIHAHAAFASKSANYLDEPCLLSEDEVGLYSLSGEPKINVVKRCVRRFYLENLQARIDAILKYCGAQKVDLVVFPEYSIPAELLPLCAEISKSLKMVIVAGSHTILNTPESQQTYRDLGLDQKLDLSISDPASDIRTAIAPVFLPDGKVHLVSKQSRSPWEGDMIVGDDRWKPFEVIFRDTRVRIALFLCIDALTSQKDLSGTIDLAVVPSLSPSTKPFQSFAQLKLLQECAVMYANVAHFGESQILARFGQRGQHWFMSEDGSRPLPRGEEGLIGLDVQLGEQYEKRRSVKEHSPVLPVFYTPLVYLCESELGSEISRIKNRLIKESGTADPKESRKVIDTLVSCHRGRMSEILTEKLEILSNSALSGGTLRAEDLDYLLDHICISPDTLAPSDLRYAMTDYCISEISGLLSESDLHRPQRAIKCLSTLINRREQLRSQMCCSVKFLSGLLKQRPKSRPNVIASRKSKPDSLVSISAEAVEENTLASFQDRTRMLNMARFFLHNDNLRIFVLRGMVGIGKTTLIRHVFLKMLPRWNQIWIDVNEGMAFPRLIVQLGKSLGVEILPELADSEDLDACRRLVRSVLRAFDSIKSTSLVLDDIDHLFGREGRIRDKRVEVLVEELLTRPARLRNKVFVLSNWRVELAPELRDKYLSVDLRPLTSVCIERILEFWTRFFREIDRDRRIEIPFKLVSLIDGHPLLAKLAAFHCRTRSLNELISDLETYRGYVSAAIRKLLDKTRLSDGEHHTMEYGSVFRSGIPLDVFRTWGGDEAIYNVDSLANRFLVEKSGDIHTIHPLIKEYFNQTTNPRDARKYHWIAADYYLEAVDEEIPSRETVSNVAEGLFHVAASGDLERLRHLKLYYKDELRPAALKAYRQYRDYKLALQLYKMLLEFGSDDADLHFHLALCYGRLRDWPNGDRHFERATQLRPSAHWIYASYGNIKLNAFQILEAEKLLVQAFELSPLDANVLVGMARLRAVQKHENEADKLFRKAVKLHPKDRFALYAYGRFLSEGEDLPKAKRILEQALSVDPHNTSVMKLLDALGDKQRRIS